MARMTSIGLAAVLAIGLAGCSRTQEQGPDPASANMAPIPEAGQLAQNPEPVQSAGYEQQLTEAPAPPPPLPEYSQPECPGENYMWTPGYWADSTQGYYWTPGAWVMAPWAGALWTPPYWGYSGTRYIWHAGYWGPHVGFYGGINYGYGYTGRGFYGGYWDNGLFAYNRSVTNVSMSIVRNVYDRRVTNYTPVNRVSYNGGRGGLDLRPVASEQAALRERRMAAVPAQVQFERQAAGNRGQFAAVNGGRPSMAVARPVAMNERPAAGAIERPGVGAIERPGAGASDRRAPAGEPFYKQAPPPNGRPERSAMPEARGTDRRAETPQAPVRNVQPVPNQPMERAHMPPMQRGPNAPTERGSMPQGGRGPVPQSGAPARPVEQGRPGLAGRQQAPEQRPSPFQGQGRQVMPQQQHQEHSADRKMIEQRPLPQPQHQERPMPQQRQQAPAGRGQSPAAAPAQHPEREAKPQAPQGRGQEPHPEPPRGGRDKQQ